MTVGGYVVRGLALSCGKRAKAIRREDGAFECVHPGSCSFALATTTTTAQLPPLQPQQPTLLLPTDDLATAASSICLATQGTPSPASDLLHEFDAQAALEASELPIHDRIQLHEDAIRQQQ